MGDVRGSCDRAREWISAELDGELSELERALLRAHVVGCDACAAFVCDVWEVTTQLRAAPLVRPDLTAFTPTRRRRVSSRTVQALAAAAAVAAVAGLGMLAAAPAPAPKRPPSAIVDMTDDKLLAIAPHYPASGP